MTEIQPEVVEVAIDPAVIELLVEPPPVTIVELTPELADIVIEPDPVVVEIGAGMVVIDGGGSGSDVVELFDSNSVPASPPDTYLRFERDLDGDVQAVYLGTVD